VKNVIPAEAGIHVATVKVKMDPRLRGDDDRIHSRRSGFGHLADGAHHCDVRKWPSFTQRT
jgi:hypothetical protein